MSAVNLPVTVWSPTNGNGEAIITGVQRLVDETGAFLVDETGAFLVDTGTDFQQLPLTIWTQNDGN